MEPGTDTEMVRSNADLCEFLRNRADQVRCGEVEIERVTAADLLEAASFCIHRLHDYFAYRGEPASTEPPWSLVAATFEEALLYP